MFIMINVIVFLVTLVLTNCKSCPIYNCDAHTSSDYRLNSTERICAHMEYNTTTNLTIINLNRFCHMELEECRFIKEHSYNNDNTLEFSNKNISICTKLNLVTKYIVKNTRFPGEDCYFDSDCKSFEDDPEFIPKCVSGHCKGVEKGEPSKYTHRCVIGLFSLNGICMELLKEKDPCIDNYDCNNNLFCVNNKCAKHNSFDFEQIDQLKTNNESLMRIMCKYPSYNNICALFDYSDNLKSKMDSKGFVECNLGEKCEYTDIYDKNQIYYLDCQCSYNSQGRAFCPKPIYRCKIYS